MANLSRAEMVRTFLKAAKLDLLIGLLSAALFIFLYMESFPVLESIGKVIYGIQMRLDLPANVADNRIAIVNIDEKSTRQLGPWPWPRSVIADMIQILKNNGARLIGLDILYPEAERNQGLQELRELQRSIVAMDGISAKDTWLLENLASIQERLDNDRILARTIRECGNVILPVLGAVGKYESTVVVPEGSPLKGSSFPVRGDMGSFVPAHQLLLPFEDLAQSCKGLGHINLSPNRLLEGEVHPLYLNYRGHLLPSLGLHLALDYMNKRPDEVLQPGKGIRLGQAVIPAVNGEVFLKFKGGKRSFPYYSFVDILNVKKVPAVFDKKIVLIGSTTEGGAFVHTPVDLEMPRIELLANVVENLMNGRFVKRPESVLYLELLLIVLASFAGAVTLPRLSFLNRMAAAAGLLFLLLLIGVFTFVALDVWLKTVYAGLSLIAVCIALSVRALVASARSQDITSKESMETNRMLGLSLQSQGLLDLAFEKFRKCDLDESMMDLVYNLGLDYERKRMMNKAISVYEYILSKDSGFRDLAERTRKLRKLSSPFPAGSGEGNKEGQIVLADDLGVRPTVGRYEIIAKVGQGAMGIVYKAMDPKINRLLAIKTVRFSDEVEEKAIKEVKARFLREAEIAGKLSHPAIVAIYDVGEDYDLTYMAMEFLEGETLQKFCRKESLLPAAPGALAHRGDRYRTGLCPFPGCGSQGHQAREHHDPERTAM